MDHNPSYILCFSVFQKPKGEFKDTKGVNLPRITEGLQPRNACFFLPRGVSETGRSPGCWVSPTPASGQKVVLAAEGSQQRATCSGEAALLHPGHDPL